MRLRGNGCRRRRIPRNSPRHVEWLALDVSPFAGGMRILAWCSARRTATGDAGFLVLSWPFAASDCRRQQWSLCGGWSRSGTQYKRRHTMPVASARCSRSPTKSLLSSPMLCSSAVTAPSLAVHRTWANAHARSSAAERDRIAAHKRQAAEFSYPPWGRPKDGIGTMRTREDSCQHLSRLGRLDSAPRRPPRWAPPRTAVLQPCRVYPVRAARLHDQFVGKRNRIGHPPPAVRRASGQEDAL